MKILLVNDKFLPERTVVGRLIFSLAQTLQKQGHDVAVFTVSPQVRAKGWFSLERRDWDGLAVYEGPKISESGFLRSYLPLFNPWVESSFKKVLHEFKPDIVHFHNIHQYLSFRLPKLAKMSGAGTVLTAHDVMLFHYGKLVEFIDPRDINKTSDFDYRVTWLQQAKRFGKRFNPLRRPLIRSYLRSVDKIIAVSYALKNVLRANGISDVEVVHNAIDPELWHTSAAEADKFKKKLGLDNRQVIFFGGRLSYLKGGDQLLAALRQVAKSIPNASLVVAGQENDYAAKLKSQAAILGLANNLVFTGWLQDDSLKAAFAAADVVVMPSICFDSFGMVNLEAMILGKPVVATCFGGAKEIVKNGVTGYIVNPFNIQDLAGKILMLLSDLSKSYGENGRTLVLREFTMNLQVQKYLAVYLQASK